MLSFVIPLWLLLVTVTADSFNSFHKYPPTEKSNMPYEDGPFPKPRKPPIHISEFTDPKTGLNPFLDIEEGRTSAGRNVMKDEILEDPPFLDFDLVEGDAPDRRLNFDVPKEPLEHSFDQRWPNIEENLVEDLPTTTIRYVSEMLPTTTDSYVTTSSTPVFDVEYTEDQKIQKAATRSLISKDSLIYALATVAVVATLALLVGVCWWRRKLKRTSQSPIAAENGELKS